MIKRVDSIRMKIIGADVAFMMTKTSELGIQFLEIKTVDLFSVEVTIKHGDRDKIRQWLNEHGYTYQVISERKMSIWFHMLKRRMILHIGVIILLILTVILPQYVLFFSVNGNSTVSDRTILDMVNKNGIYLGTRKKNIDATQFKNALLNSLNQLDWVGLIISGSHAQVSIHERAVNEEVQNSEGAVGNIVAACDGIILSATAHRGTLQVEPGQSVKRGELLISGYTDCGLTIHAEIPEGDIMAKTIRDLSVISPAERLVRTDEIDTDSRFGLRIGKNIIKFYKDSGIYPPGCVKMYSEEYWKLPGGYILPVAWTKEVIQQHKTTTEYLNPDALYEMMYSFANHFIRNQMIAGEFSNVHTDFQFEEAYARLSCQYVCRESIGLFVSEEYIR